MLVNIAIISNMQADPPPPPAPPTIDIGGLAQAIADALLNTVQRAIPDLLGSVGQAAGSNVHSATDTLWNALWTSGANVFTQTSAAQTINFGPIAGYTTEAQFAAYGIILLGVVLLGLRTMLSSFVPTSADTIGELLYGIATAMILAGALPVLMLRAIDVLNLALRQLAGLNLASSLPQTGGDAIVTAVLLLLVALYGVKFIVKSMKRLVVLAVLTPFGPIAMLLRAIPSTRWVSGWWARTWGGLLVAQAPAALALAIGVQMAAYSGILGALWTVAFLGAAADMLDLFGYGMIGGSGPGLLGAGMAAGRVVTGLAAASSAGAVASGAADFGGISAAQAAENYGYD